MKNRNFGWRVRVNLAGWVVAILCSGAKLAWDIWGDGSKPGALIFLDAGALIGFIVALSTLPIGRRARRSTTAETPPEP